MPSVKKRNPISIKVIDKNIAIAALEIYIFALRGGTYVVETGELAQKTKEFNRTHQLSYYDVMDEIQRSSPNIFQAGKYVTLDKLYEDYVTYLSTTDSVPTKLPTYYLGKHISDEWVFKGYVYEVKGSYSDDEIKLLILENFDKERKFWEKLRTKFSEAENTDLNYKRPRIPENIRIEVWRRDSGKCARCGSREKLEYDHIVPISKGGSNTARNIELLCEKCNRSKSNNVV